MGSPGRNQSYVKRGVEEGSNGKIGEGMDNEEYEEHEKSKFKSRKSRKSSHGEDVDKCVGDRRKKSSGDRNENRKRVGRSSKDYSDEDDYGTRKESRSDKLKTKQEESTLEKLSSWYKDRDAKHDGGYRSGDRAHSHVDENVKSSVRKTALKLKDAEESHVRSKSKDERLYDFDREKVMDKDLRRADKSENSRAKLHESSERENRRLEDSDTAKNQEENSYPDRRDSRSRKSLDLKSETIRERSTSKLETYESKRRALGSSNEKDKLLSEEEKSIDADRTKKRSKRDSVEEDYKDGSEIRDDISVRKRSHTYKENSGIDNDGLESRRKSINSEEGKSGKDIGYSKRSRTPEISGSSLKMKEVDKEVYRDDRIKDRDECHGDKNRNRDGSKENWKRIQPGSNDRDGESELSRRGRDMMDNERPLIRSGIRKDGRGEAVKASSKFGISTENYDIIEIQRKPLDYPRNDDLTQSELKSPPNDAPGLSSTGDISKEKCKDEGTSKEKVTTSSGSLPPVANDEPGSQGQPIQQGIKAGRLGRPSRIRPNVRDIQQANMPVHLMGPPFGPLGIPPPGPMQQLNPAMSPAHPGVFMTPFSPPVWPGPLPQRFGPNMGNSPNPIMFFNQSGPIRGMSSDSGFNAMAPFVRGQSQDKASGGWVPPHNKGVPGKAPSRGEQNDYSQNFVDTGMRPQNFIRELELSNVEDYPKLRELIQKKDEIVAKVASAPMYHKCDLKEFVLSPEFFGTKFDVILVDPPWEEYVHRAPGVTDNMDSWTVEDIMNLKIEAIADTPSFVFLWVGDGVGLEQGRQCLKKWGFRRCEDICWVKTNKNTATPALRHDSHTLFQHTKEHCLMGIKGTVRRSTDGHIIHANIDTDVIIAEEPAYGSTAKPDEMYRIIEHFALGCRRLELFGEDHNIRPGWLTLGKQLSTSNFNSEAYTRHFSDKDGKVWQGGGGRNPPPEAPHLVLTTPEIESLRPKSPMKNQQQLQQSSSISLTANSSNRKPSINSPHTPNPFGSSQDVSGDLVPPPWASMGRDIGSFGPYGYGGPPPVVPLPNQEVVEFEPKRSVNILQR